MDYMMSPEAQMSLWITAGVVAAILFVVLVAILRAFIKVCPPNRVMIIEGMSTRVDGRRYGFRVIRGGYAIVVPYFTRARFLDLSVIPINVRVENCNAADGIVVGADATACVGIDLNDDVMLYTGVEKLIGKSREEIHDQIKDTLVGNFRGAMGRSTPLEAMGMEESRQLLDQGQPIEGEDLSTLADDDAPVERGDRARFRRDLLATMNEDLSNFGVRVFSVSLMRIWDQSEYISNLAAKAVASKRQEVEIAEAQYAANAANAESDGQRRRDIACNQADEAIAKAQQALGVTKSEYTAAVARAQKTAQASIDSARHKAQVAVEQSQSELQELRNRTEKTIKAKSDMQAAQIRAEGQTRADDIRQGARNEMLQAIVQILGDTEGAELPLFINKQLPQMYATYKQAAAGINFDNITLLGDDDSDSAINAAVNRGPAAMADFLERFEQLYGVSLRGILGSDNGPQPPASDSHSQTAAQSAPSVQEG